MKPETAFAIEAIPASVLEELCVAAIQETKKTVCCNRRPKTGQIKARKDSDYHTTERNAVQADC